MQKRTIIIWCNTSTLEYFRYFLVKSMQILNCLICWDYHCLVEFVKQKWFCKLGRFFWVSYQNFCHDVVTCIGIYCISWTKKCYKQYRFIVLKIKTICFLMKKSNVFGFQGMMNAAIALAATVSQCLVKYTSHFKSQCG